MIKFFFVLLSCGPAFGILLPHFFQQHHYPPNVCRKTTGQTNVESIPWEEINRHTLLKNDDYAEGLVYGDVAGTPEELTANTTAGECSQPYHKYYHANPCRTIVTFGPLTSPRNVRGLSVAVISPTDFQQIKCRRDGCKKCPGKCVQKYKYQMVLIRKYCQVYWDRVKVPVGCSCHHYLPYFYVG